MGRCLGLSTGYRKVVQVAQGNKHDIKLSVVIPCYNGAKTIAVQLGALARQKWPEPWEVVIADNGSTDESMSIVTSYRDRLPNLRILDASARAGQPYALNVGARAAKGEALVFCDDDDEVAPGWIAAMGEALSEMDFVACRTDITKLNPTWVQKSRQNLQSEGIQNYPGYLPHAGGGTIGVKRWLYEEVGGFDESLPFLHDTDFCWKIQLKGIKLHFVPDAVMHLRFRDTMKDTYRQARGYAEYRVILYKRYRSFGMPKIPWKKNAYVLLKWIKMFGELVQIRDKGDLAHFMRNLGVRVGRLKACIKYRVLAL